MASSSSKNHIDIDWSTPSTHSFVQLGTTSTSRDDSHYYVQDFEPEVILTSKDIFYIDIDDILPPSADTAHYPRKKNFPLLLSANVARRQEEFLRQDAIRIQEQKNKQHHVLEQNTAYYDEITRHHNNGDSTQQKCLEKELDAYLKRFPCFNNIYNKFASSQRYNKLPMVGRLSKEDELNLKDDPNACVTYLFDSSYTSDDTKAIEARPLKRDTNSVQLITSPPDRTKRTHQDSSSIDSVVVGSSKNNFFVTY
ncbi:hypothetical protein C1646_759955 [Rhizophagus diaphanus]|nr:hypothetical protein C1646_759955 [Rhizophagus diaphanus] [Rhizophagus sp. MUCL 43196]